MVSIELIGNINDRLRLQERLRLERKSLGEVAKAMATSSRRSDDSGSRLEAEAWDKVAKQVDRYGGYTINDLRKLKFHNDLLNKARGKALE